MDIKEINSMSRMDLWMAINYGNQDATCGSCNCEDCSAVRCYNIFAFIIDMKIKVFPQLKTDKWFAIAQGDVSSHAHIGDDIYSAVGKAILIKQAQDKQVKEALANLSED